MSKTWKWFFIVAITLDVAIAVVASFGESYAKSASFYAAACVLLLMRRDILDDER